MKTISTLFVGIFLFLLCAGMGQKEDPVKKTVSQQGSLQISCTPDLYDLTSAWASEYQRLNPQVQTSVIQSAYSGSGVNQGLSFISGKSEAAVQNVLNWKMVIGRDVTVPVMNAENPLLTEIQAKGISAQRFIQVFNATDKQSWGTLLANTQAAPVHIYVVNDESVKESVARFLQLNQVPVNGITMGNSAQVITAIQKDPYAIGFCKAVDIMQADNQKLVEKLSLLPIDRNGNGKIDPMEDIYKDMTLFSRGVWIGKYPKSLYTNIYAVSKVQPSGEPEVAFLRWVLTDGQQFMNAKGYSDLVSSESQSQLDKINTTIINVPTSGDATLKGLIVLILAVIITLIISINAVVRRSGKKTAITGASGSQSPVFDHNTLVVPQGLYFSKTHTWVFMEKEGTVAIGIDDFLQHVTGPITRVEMKQPGEKIKKGDLLLSIIQSGKQLKVFAPISGTIKEQNEALIMNSAYLNSAPYAEGWVYKIEPLNWSKEIQLLDMAEKYKRWIETEFSRVKDFLAATLKPDSLEYSHVVLQDGGVLKDGVLSDFGPEIWEDFQTNFLDS